MPFCLKESCIEQNTATQAFGDHIGQQLNMTITNLAVSFMNIAGVFQIQIVLDL